MKSADDGDAGWVAPADNNKFWFNANLPVGDIISAHNQILPANGKNEDDKKLFSGKLLSLNHCIKKK